MDGLSIHREVTIERREGVLGGKGSNLTVCTSLPTTPSTATANSPKTYFEAETAVVPPRNLEVENHEIQSAAPFSPMYEIAFVFTICMAQIMSLAGVLQSLAPLHIMGNSFGVTDPGQLSWFIASFSLTVGTFILPAGRLGDIYGHKRIHLLGWIWYGVWSLVAGLSVYSGPILFTVARGFQGIGPALLVPNAVAIVGRTYPMGKRKNIIFSLFGACAPIGATFGALFSSIFSQLSWWPWTFFSMAIVCLVLLYTSYLILPPDEILDSNDGQKPNFDYAGCLTGVGGLILVNFAWNQAGVVGWSVPYNYILLIIGIILLAIFFYIELHIAIHPLLPLKSLTKESGFAVACIAVSWGSFGIWLFYSWQFFEILRGHSPLSVTAQTCPVAISGTIASLLTGFLISKLGVSRIMFVSMLAFLIGQILFAIAPVHQTYWALTFVSILIMPWGMDLSFPAGVIILSDSLPREHQGIAASLVSTVVNYSISLGLGVAGTITRNIDPDGSELLSGYRGAWYFAIGLDAVGVCIAAYFVWSSSEKSTFWISAPVF